MFTRTALIGLQPTKTGAELDSSTVLIFETNILRVMSITRYKYCARDALVLRALLCTASQAKGLWLDIRAKMRSHISHVAQSTDPSQTQWSMPCIIEVLSSITAAKALYMIDKNMVT